MALAGCPLCLRAPLRPQPYRDGVCWVTWCDTHPAKQMVVLLDHRDHASNEERVHMFQIAHNLFPETKNWRLAAGATDHFHLHAE